MLAVSIHQVPIAATVLAPNLDGIPKAVKRHIMVSWIEAPPNCRLRTTIPPFLNAPLASQANAADC